MEIWLFIGFSLFFPLYLILLVNMCRNLYADILKEFLIEIITESFGKNLYYREFDISRIIENSTKRGITSAYYENVQRR